MSAVRKAIASDLDGTLSQHDRVAPSIRAALTQVRLRGVATILVTGRVMTDLTRLFPGLDSLFDAVVAENGASVRIDGFAPTLLAPRCDPELLRLLRERGIAVEEGLCVLSVGAEHAAATWELLTCLGQDLSALPNRGRLMIMPSGVSKATGLRVVLKELGVSRHNLAVIGDAQNDLAMFALARLSVAVAEALPVVIERADLVLEVAGSQGVTGFLSEFGASDLWPPSRAREQIHIGTDQAGVGVWVGGDPDINVFIVGPSGSGKSYLAGLLVERWVERDYRCLIIDVEGDYVGLGTLPDVVVLSSSEAPDELILNQLLKWSQLSIVLDLSKVDLPARQEFLKSFPEFVRSARRKYGVPHWTVVDEAQSTLGVATSTASRIGASERGYVLVSWQPDRIEAPCPPIGLTLEVISAREGSSWVDLTDERHDRPLRFNPDPRRSPHIRHWHKYASVMLPPPHWFWFTDPVTGEAVGCARSVSEFTSAIGTLPTGVLDRHLSRGDVSRWLAGVREFAPEALGPGESHARAADALSWPDTISERDGNDPDRVRSARQSHSSVGDPEVPRSLGAPAVVGLCEAALELLEGSAFTGLTLARCGDSGVSALLFASDAIGPRLLEAGELLGEGPTEAVQSARGPILTPDLLSSSVPTSWHQFVREATALGARSLFVFPVQIGAALLGMLILYGAEPAVMARPRLAQFLLVVEQIAEQLIRPASASSQTAWERGLLDEPHSTLHQAAGMVSAQLQAGIIDALAAIRARAYADGVAPNVIARAIVARELRFDGELEGPGTQQGDTDG